MKEKRIKPLKIHTDVNPADLMTKPLNEDKIVNLMKIMGYFELPGELKMD